MESGAEHVVLVTDQAPLSGIGVYVSQLANLLTGSAERVDVRSLHYFPFAVAPPHVPSGDQRYARSRWGVLPALRANERRFAEEAAGRPGLVHLCGASYDLAVRLPRAVATVHDFGLRTLGSLAHTEPRLVLVEGYGLVEWLRLPRFLRRCRAIVSISEFTRERLRAMTGLESRVIPLWTDPARFAPRAQSASRARLGIPPDRRVVLSVTSGRAYKNPQLLDRVVATLPADHLLVKVGFPASGPPDRVRNVGRVPDELYPTYFTAADAYLHLSLREGFGRPLLEAMASGTPVVSLANPPAPEILGDAARWVPAGARAPAVVAAVRSVTEDPGTARTLSAAGRQRATAFDPAMARAAYLDLYRDALRR
jgi:glycosyltransferase involved in cell wall biosynthesis